MKKLITLLVALLAFSVPGKASVEDDAHWGVRAQFGMNTTTGRDDMVSWGPGGSVGIAYYAPFGRLTYFNGGLLFGYETFGFEGTTDNKYNPVVIDGHMHTLGLRMPLDIGLKFYSTDRVRLSIYTGPHLYFNFALKAKYDETRGSSVNKVEKSFKNSGMEFTWGLGLAADFCRHWHVHVEGVYALSRMGWTDEIKVGWTAHFNRASIAVGLGYNF